MTGSWQTITLPSQLSPDIPFNGDVMLLLTDGSLFIHNSRGKEWLRFYPDPQQGYVGKDWSTIYIQSNMSHAREYFASGVLKDGRVFAIGGEEIDYKDGDSPLAEIFDPQTNSWSPLDKPSDFNYICGDCHGAVLSDGRVLLGGVKPDGTNKTAIWDPHNNKWTEAGIRSNKHNETNKNDAFNEESMVLLPGGRVLAPGVWNSKPYTAQVYDPSEDSWINCDAPPVQLPTQTINGTSWFEIGPTVLLPNGKVLVIGGTGNTAIFTPGPDVNDGKRWTIGPTFPVDASAFPLLPTLTAIDAPACLLPNGKVILMGGTTTQDENTKDIEYYSKNPVFLEYDPNSTLNVIPKLDIQPPNMPTKDDWTFCWFFLLLPTGQLLCSNLNSNTLWLYTPDPDSGSPNPLWKPANISVPTTMIQGHRYTVYGTQINGLSQAVFYGDDYGMATNYPIIRLTNPRTGDIHYVRSYNFSTMGVATGNTVPNNIQSCTVDIPHNFGIGHWNLTVIANGISSDDVAIKIVSFHN